MLTAHSPKQDKRRPSEKDANVHPHITCIQVAMTSIPTSSRPKLIASVPTSQVPKSKKNISDSNQVPGGNRQVLANDIRHVPYCSSTTTTCSLLII